MLDGRVWFDETFYTIRSDDIQVKEDGTKPRGLSKNQLCIGVACTKNHILCLLEGTGQPTARKAHMTFGSHITEGSLHAHTSFDRETLQGYLNLFSFTMNPPAEHLEKVEALLNLALNTRKTLRYRSFYRME